MVLRIRPDRAGGHLEGYDFFPLPARPMFRMTLEASGHAPLETLRRQLAALPADAIVRLHAAVPGITSALLREIAPAGMNIDLAWTVGWTGAS